MRTNHIIAVGLLSLFTIVSFSGAILMSSYASADTEVIDEVSLTVPVACTMGGVGTDSHNATLNPGTYSGASGSEYESGIGKTTLTVFCNDSNGFSIYAIGYTNDLYEGELHTKLVGQNTHQTIETKAYESGDANSNWSMKITKVDNPVSSDPVTYNPQNMNVVGSFNTWQAIPDTYAKVAEYHSTTTDPSTTDTTLGAKLETTYASYIASTQPADTYTGQVKYTMVHPYDNMAKDGPIVDCPANKICYSPNANDIEGTMGQQPIVNPATSTSATLLASNFSRKGYGFAGWSDRYDYSNNNGAKLYGPNETIFFTAGQYSSVNGGLKLYAIWIPSQGYFQDNAKVAQLCGANGIGGSLITAPTDGTVNLDSVSALTDQRDGETYAIARLADGNCWMTENLRIEAEGTRGATNEALSQGYSKSVKYGNFIGLADAEYSQFSNIASENSIYYSGTKQGAAIVNIGTSDLPAWRIPRYNNSNTKNKATNPTENNNNMYSYGNYYTWHAGIANTILYTNGNHNTTSICPSGWGIPTGDSLSADFNALDLELGGTGEYQGNSESSNRWRKYPNNFIFSGKYSGSMMDDRGYSGFYWSSTVRRELYAAYLQIQPNTLRPGIGVFDKYLGQSIRCIVNH